MDDITNSGAALPELPLAYEYVYGWADGARKLSPSTRNGCRPETSETVYTADQMRAYARQAIAADRAARQAPVVPAGEPVVTVKRGARTPWGYAGVVVLWGPGLQDLPPGLHQLYTAPASPLQQAQDGERDTKRLDWLAGHVKCAIGRTMLDDTSGPEQWRKAIDAAMAAIQSDAARKEGEKG